MDLPCARGDYCTARSDDTFSVSRAVVMTDLAIGVTATQGCVLRTPIGVGRSISAEVKVTDSSCGELAPDLAHLQHAASG